LEEGSAEVDSPAEVAVSVEVEAAGHGKKIWRFDMASWELDFISPIFARL
jgi:hypothetical protein